MSMTSRLGSLFTFTLVTALGASACSGGGAEPQTASAGSAPDFSLQSVDGKTVRLSEYAGKSVVLLDFWSTTCDPCMVEMPHLVDLYKANKDKGFVVLAISLDGPESLAEVNRVVHDKDMIFPVLLDQETVVVSRYNPKKEMPFSVLIGKDGNIIEKHAGYQPGDEKALGEKVEKALAAK
ncbi:MAG: TlpA disulfide reductase family protein [Byssovorax sp.]